MFPLFCLIKAEISFISHILKMSCLPIVEKDVFSE